MIHPLDPIYNAQSKILILGSFPSVISRATHFYYAHPQNRFWQVLSALAQCPLPQTIDEKKALLLKHHIAVWDVIHSCDIHGSSDQSIRNVIPNDLRQLLSESQIESIYANGTKAMQLYRQYCLSSTQREIVCLPSTSPANRRLSLEQLIKIWDDKINLSRFDTITEYHALK